MSRQTMHFDNHQGERLSGILDLPDAGPPRATALFAHCFTCTKDLKAAARISAALNRAGLAVFRFDFTGLGDSEGDFADTNFSTSVADLEAAAEFLAAQGYPPAMAIGHSLGGAAVLMAAPAIGSLEAVVTIGAPGRADHVTQLFAGRNDELERAGEAVVDIGGRPFRIRQQLVEDLAASSVPERAAHLRLPLLILHAPLDRIVGIDNAAEIFTRAMHPKSFVSLDQADHLLSDSRDADYAGVVIAAWSSRYLPVADPAQATDEPADRVTATTGAQGYTTPIMAHGHPLTADEPASVGGSDRGPTPYGLLSAALASCTSMTLQMYARRKELNLDNVSVGVTHEKIHADDCADCETQSGRIDRFDRHIELQGKLTDSERERLFEIADKCPVHRTLEGEIEIRTFATGD